MKYAVEMGSVGMIYVPSFIKIQKLVGKDKPSLIFSK
jgi:hypothetical protein